MSSRQSTRSQWVRPESVLTRKKIKSETITKPRAHQQRDCTSSSFRPGAAEQQPTPNRGPPDTRMQRDSSRDAVRSSCCNLDMFKNGGRRCKACASQVSAGVMAAIKNKGLQVYKETLQAGDMQGQQGGWPGIPDAHRRIL